MNTSIYSGIYNYHNIVLITDEEANTQNVNLLA